MEAEIRHSSILSRFGRKEVLEKSDVTVDRWQTLALFLICASSIQRIGKNGVFNL